MEKNPESISSDWNNNIVTILNMILLKGSRSKAYDSLKVILIREKTYHS